MKKYYALKFRVFQSENEFRNDNAVRQDKDNDIFEVLCFNSQSEAENMYKIMKKELDGLYNGYGSRVLSKRDVLDRIHYQMKFLSSKSIGSFSNIRSVEFIRDNSEEEFIQDFVGNKYILVRKMALPIFKPIQRM